MKLNHSVSLEAIAFQGKMFGLELEMFFTDLRKVSTDVKEFLNYSENNRFSEIVKKYTGLSIILNLHEKLPYGPCVYLPKLHNNHIFIDNQIKPYLKSLASIDFINSIVSTKGKNSVDTKEVKVSGAFSKVVSVINYDYTTITNTQYTVPELVAVTLHEIGHVFNYFDYFDRTITTNQILKGVSDAYMNTSNYEERKDLIQSAATALTIDIKQMPDLSDSDAAKMGVIALLRKGAMTSQTASAVYDKTTEEALADQFAVRFGYGREVALYMQKAGEFKTSRLSIIRGMSYLSESWKTLPIGWPLFWSIVVGPALAAAVFSLMLMMRTVGKTTASNDYTYDDGKTRLKRVREQLIAILKDQNLDKELVKQTIQDIGCIDEISKYVIDKKEMINAIADFIRPFSDSPAAMIKLNRQLEELANNDLYLSAAKLNSLKL